MSGRPGGGAHDDPPRGDDGPPHDSRDEDAPRVREVAAAVVRRAGRVLVQTRTDSWRGWWEFPGGGREPGESLEQTVVRECLEELGLPVRVVSELHRRAWSYPGRRVLVAFFTCEPDEGVEPRPLLGQELRWALPDELPGLRMLPSNAEVVALLRAVAPEDRA